MKLFRVELKVRPTKDHPAYWEMQCGFLYLWVFDNAPEEAREHAVSMAKLLPYEMASPFARTIEIDGREEIEPLKNAAKSARETGFSLLLAHADTGTDEAQFLQDNYWLG